MSAAMDFGSSGSTYGKASRTISLAGWAAADSFRATSVSSRWTTRARLLLLDTVSMVDARNVVERKVDG
eukprot:scaffold12909_cov133-Skeletonema_marinoi.AAC.4